MKGVGQVLEEKDYLGLAEHSSRRFTRIRVPINEDFLFHRRISAIESASIGERLNLSYTDLEGYLLYMDLILIEEGFFKSRKEYVLHREKTFKELDEQAKTDLVLKKIIK